MNLSSPSPELIFRMSPPDPSFLSRPATPHSGASNHPAVLFARAREQSAMAGMSHAALKARARKEPDDTTGLYNFPFSRVSGPPQRVPTPPIRHRRPIFGLPSLPGVDSHMDEVAARERTLSSAHPLSQTHGRSQSHSNAQSQSYTVTHSSTTRGCTSMHSRRDLDTEDTKDEETAKDGGKGKGKGKGKEKGKGKGVTKYSRGGEEVESHAAKPVKIKGSHVKDRTPLEDPGVFDYEEDSSGDDIVLYTKTAALDIPNADRAEKAHRNLRDYHTRRESDQGQHSYAHGQLPTTSSQGRPLTSQTRGHETRGPPATRPQAIPIPAQASRPQYTHGRSSTRDTSHHGHNSAHQSAHQSSHRHHSSGTNPATSYHHPFPGVPSSSQATQATYPIHAHATPSRHPLSPRVPLLRVERRDQGGGAW